MVRTPMRAQIPICITNRRVPSYRFSPFHFSDELHTCMQLMSAAFRWKGSSGSLEERATVRSFASALQSAKNFP
jgi:hypothetical protein